VHRIINSGLTVYESLLNKLLKGVLRLRMNTVRSGRPVSLICMFHKAARYITNLLHV
jgi:hypothetical protein